MTEIKIAVVDDELIQLEMFEDDFNEFNVITFDSSIEAYNDFKKNSYHIIILDYYMPSLNGGQLCKMIKKDSVNLNAYLIAYSAESDLKKKIEIINNGFDDFIPKVKEYDEIILIKAKLNAIINRNGKTLINPLNSVFSLESYDFLLNGMNLKLTKSEYEIFKILFNSKNSYKSSYEIHKELYKQEPLNQSYSRSIISHISNIKKKFAEIDPYTKYLETFSEVYKLIIY